MKHRLAVVAVGIILAACGPAVGPATQAIPDPPASEPAAAETPEPPRIGPDGPEPPDVQELVAYGERHRDVFGGLYIDPPGGRSVVMLFTRDLEAHQQAVGEIRPGTRVRQVRFSEAELRELQASFAPPRFDGEDVELLSTSVDVIGNKVVLTLKSDDPTLELRLEATHGGMLDAFVFPFPGPWANVESGDGWRLLAAGDGSAEAYTVRAATSPAEWNALWEAVGLDGDQPAVDLDTEVVVSFGHGLSQSCPELRLDDVLIDGAVVSTVTSDPLAPRGCNLDLSAGAVFIAALDRDALPEGGFTLQLDERSAGCCGDLDELDVPLP